MQREPATVLRSICADPALRRQFLWLRAREKGDLETVRELESIDPTLNRRMAELQAEFIANGGQLDTLEQQRDGFGRMQDQLFERCAERAGEQGEG